MSHADKPLANCLNALLAVKEQGNKFKATFMPIEKLFSLLMENSVIIAID